MIKWLYDNYALTGIIALYYMSLLGYGTHAVFSQLDIVNASVGTVYIALLGLPPTAIGLIKWRLEKDNDKTD